MANTLTNIEFKTSSATGSTQRQTTGEGLANLLITSLESANKLVDFNYTQEARKQAESNRIKSQNEEQDKLLYSDLKFKTLDYLTKNDFDNQTSENQTKILDGIKGIQRPEFFNRTYENDYGTFLNKYEQDINKKKNDEITNNINDSIIPKIGQNAQVLTMNDIDFYSDNFTNLGFKDAKTKVIKSVVGQIDGILQSDTKYKKMSKEQILSSFPILNEIQDENLKSTVNARITMFDENYKKELYTNDINTSILNNKATTKDMFMLANNHNKNILEVRNDFANKAKDTIDLLTSLDDAVYDKQAINISKQFNTKIDRVDKTIPNLISSAITDSASAFEDYKYAKRMIIAGYVPNADNTRDMNILTGIANDLNIKLEDSTSFEKVANFAMQKRDNPNSEITLKELDDFQTTKGLVFDSTLSDLDKGIQKEFIYSKAKELSRYMSKESAVNIAMEMSSKYILGTDTKTDWSGIDNITTNEESDAFTNDIKEKLNLGSVSISKTPNGDNFVITGKLKDGTNSDTHIYTMAQMNNLVNNFTQTNNERKLYEDMLKNKKEYEAIMKKEYKSSKISLSEVMTGNFDKNKLLTSIYSSIKANEGLGGDNVTGISTGNYGLTESKKLELENKYGTKFDDETAIKVLITENSLALEASLSGYNKLTDNAKIAINDTMYNLGSFKDLTKFKDAVSKGDGSQAMYELLDTANVDGQSVIGLARRRAENYNLVASNKIYKVQQDDNGTISYLDKNDDTILEYSPKNGKHEKSKSGEILIKDKSKDVNELKIFKQDKLLSDLIK